MLTKGSLLFGCALNKGAGVARPHQKARELEQKQKKKPKEKKAKGNKPY